jgi:hypothetical protein
VGKYPKKRRLSSEERVALQILANSPNGATDEFLVQNHGFMHRLLSGLVSAGLATMQRHVIKAGARALEVNRIIITDAGRRAIEE